MALVSLSSLLVPLGGFGLVRAAEPALLPRLFVLAE